jgi:hypothetical protein
MSMSRSSDPGPQRKPPEVPRDPDAATATDRSAPTPSPADVNTPDEEYTDQDKPLVAGSEAARGLHDQPPKSRGGLGVGTAGDAARPSKPGLHNKPLPPRGRP